MRKTAAALVAICGALIGAGCEATLEGTCDDATRAVALTVACTPEQVPQYAGQALLNGTCAGAFCHSSSARNHADPANPDSRHGVPGGFDFNLDYAGTAAELDRLRAHQAYVFEERAELFDQVASGDMPPAPQPGFDPVHAVQGTFADTGEELPTLDTAAGRAILRAWLLCGAPVVERTSDQPAAPGTPVGDALSPLLCATPEPTFDALFDGVISGSCAVDGCHAGTPPSGLLTLFPDDASASYASLVGVAAMGPMCTDTARTRIVAGDPAGSLLIQKLEGDGSSDGAACGNRMPLGGPYLPPATIAAFRDWIAAGALR